MNDAAIFQDAAVCLTKFGEDSGQAVCKILHRKELERQSGKDEHEHEFWWGIGETGRDQSIDHLINVHKAKSVIFDAATSPTKSQKLRETDTVLVWRRYRTIGEHQGIIPANVLVTSKETEKYFVLVCKSQNSILLCNSHDGRRFANCHYKYLKTSGRLGESCGRGQHTTSPLVRCATTPTAVADCDSVIEFSADLPHPIASGCSTESRFRSHVLMS